MKKITEVARPVVGKFYLVPCVEYKSPLRRFWPVMGPWHEDADLGLAAHHFHFDHRFLGVDYSMGRVQTSPTGKEMPIVWRRMKMKKEMPIFPSALQQGAALERKFQETRMTCLICPHRGMPLNGLPVTKGKIVCPGHGLQWEVATGKLVRRYRDLPV